MGRQAKGVRLIKLDKNQKLASLAVFQEEEKEPDRGDGTGSGKKVKVLVRADGKESDATETLQFSEQTEDVLEEVAAEITEAKSTENLEVQPAAETIAVEEKIEGSEEVKEEETFVGPKKKEKNNATVKAKELAEDFSQNSFLDSSSVSKDDSDSNDEPDSFMQF